MSGRTFYITTAIPYANGAPHIGHAYERIATDAIARFKRLDGYDVLFVTGVDEHGLKMLQTAQREGITPLQLGDRTAAEFLAMGEVWKRRPMISCARRRSATSAPRRRSGKACRPPATFISRNIPAGTRFATKPITTKAS